MLETGRAGIVVVAAVSGAIGLFGAGCDGCEAEGQKSGIPDPDPAPHNVLLIVVDTLRADHLGAYGHDANLSPNIDALASNGTRLTHVTSAPLEQNDLWEDTDAAPEGMRKQLAKLLTRWSEQRVGDTRGNRIEDSELKQSLRALGYTQ